MNTDGFREAHAGRPVNTAVIHRDVINTFREYLCSSVFIRGSNAFRPLNARCL